MADDPESLPEEFIVKSRSLVLACLAVVVVYLNADAVIACPMCKTAAENAAPNPVVQAYAASIALMLSVPAALFGVLGVAMYRVVCREAAFEQQTDAFRVSAASPPATGESPPAVSPDQSVT